MSHDHSALIAQFRKFLIQQRYNAMVVHNYCCNADDFLDYLDRRKISIEIATPTEVSNYLRCAVRWFHERHGYSCAPLWPSIPRAGIHALLRLVQKRWPPEPTVSDPGEIFCQAVCSEYREWLSVQRGLAPATIRALMWEARNFLAWYIEHNGVRLKDLTIRDIDAYFNLRAPGLRRRSLKDVAERLRSLMRYLHRTERIPVDFAPHVISPVLYAYETIPSTLDSEQINAVLKHTKKDRSPIGLRDYAILQLLSTYGLRAGEIKHLQLDDINWRAESLLIRHSKTHGHSLLPLMSPAGESLINYLRRGRPKTQFREIFLRARAPYRPLIEIYSAVRYRLEAAGVLPQGKCGPHIFRHARAVSLLRSSVPRKIIGDVLGHRSTESANAYLRLATEDLRAIALEIPDQEVQP